MAFTTTQIFLKRCEFVCELIQVGFNLSRLLREMVAYEGGHLERLSTIRFLPYNAAQEGSKF